MNDQKAGCLFGWLSRFAKEPTYQQKTLQTPRVMVSNRFITVEENAFFHVLRSTVGNRGYILAQVSYKRLLFLPGNPPDRAAWQNKIDKRSLDFLICDSNTLRPRVAIELDDSTHEKGNRRARDAEIKALLEAAGLPLLRFPCTRHYDAQALSAAILPHLSK